jgi:hypothetical protein
VAPHSARGQHVHESHRDFASQSSGRTGGHPDGRAARHLRARQTTDTALPERRRAGHLDLHDVACGGAHRNRIRNHRAAGARAGGPARHALSQCVRERRQRVPQPAVRGGHRHAGDDARSDQPHESAAAVATRRAGAADLARRGRRQRPQQHAVVVLRATAARHTGPHRQLPPPDRRVVPQSHRVDSRRLERTHQFRLRRRTADRVRPRARRGARHPDPAHRAGGWQRRRRFRRLRGHRPPPVHDAFRGPVFDGSVRGSRDRVARRPSRAARRHRHHPGEARRSHRPRAAERQPGHRHPDHERERRQRSRHADCRESAGGFAARERAQEVGAVDRAVVRSLGVHRSGDRHGHRQPVRGHSARGGRVVVLRARPARHVAGGSVHPDLPHGHARDAVRVRAHPQRHLARGSCVRRGPGARHRHRHARGHRTAARARACPHRSDARRREAGVACVARVHRHRRDRVSPHRLHARCGVAAVRRPGAHDFHRRHRLAHRLRDRVAARGLPLAERGGRSTTCRP